MKPLKINDSNLFQEATTLTVEAVRIDNKDTVQLALFSDPCLDGEGIFLTEEHVLKLYHWLEYYLGRA